MLELILFTVFFTLLLAGIGYWLQSGMKAEIEQRRSARSWPKTTGTVTNTDIEEEKRWMISLGTGLLPRTISLHRYKPVIHYTYQVAGGTYQSSKYKNGLISRTGEWTSLIPKEVEKIIAEHPQGKTVTVSYNPEDASRAYLELDTSETAQSARRVGGLLLIAAAVCLLALGGYRVSGMLANQQAAGNIPAAIPTQMEELKNGLGRDLGLTCQSKPSGVGQEITYTRWDCNNPTGGGGASSYVGIYNRKLAPDSVDSVHALTGETDPQKKIAFFMTVTRLAVPTADPQAVQTWLEKVQPTLTEVGSKAETAINGVNFNLGNPNGLGLVLEIGEIK